MTTSQATTGWLSTAKRWLTRNTAATAVGDFEKTPNRDLTTLATQPAQPASMWNWWGAKPAQSNQSVSPKDTMQSGPASPAPQGSKWWTAYTPAAAYRSVAGWWSGKPEPTAALSTQATQPRGGVTVMSSADLDDFLQHIRSEREGWEAQKQKQKQWMETLTSQSVAERQSRYESAISGADEYEKTMFNRLTPAQMQELGLCDDTAALSTQGRAIKAARNNAEQCMDELTTLQSAPPGITDDTTNGARPKSKKKKSVKFGELPGEDTTAPTRGAKPSNKRKTWCTDTRIIPTTQRSVVTVN